MQQRNVGRRRILLPYTGLILALSVTSGIVASAVLKGIADGGLDMQMIPIYSVMCAIVLAALLAGLSFLLSKVLRRTTQSAMDEMEHRMHEAEHIATDMTNIAYQDSLTHVKSLAAYDEYVTGLEEQITTADNEHKPEFSVVMADLNNLKEINDTYGHEAGNKYLLTACNAISASFKHSPVFRIGGDEFAIILIGYDHHHRRQLVGFLEDTARKVSAGHEDEPWKICSIAVGIATYHKGIDMSYSEVFDRADATMYRKKAEMKERAARGIN